MTPDPCSDLGEPLGLDRGARPFPQGIPKATGHDYHNGCHYRKLALERAVAALRKIRLGHPCDLPDRIAALAVEDVDVILAGGTPPERVAYY